MFCALLLFLSLPRRKIEWGKIEWGNLTIEFLHVLSCLLFMFASIILVFIPWCCVVVSVVVIVIVCVFVLFVATKGTK